MEYRRFPLSSLQNLLKQYTYLFAEYLEGAYGLIDFLNFKTYNYVNLYANICKQIFVQNV